MGEMGEMGIHANYSFEVKNIEIWVSPFIKHNNSSLATGAESAVLHAHMEACTTPKFGLFRLCKLYMKNLKEDNYFRWKVIHETISISAWWENPWKANYSSKYKSSLTFTILFVETIIRVCVVYVCKVCVCKVCILHGLCVHIVSTLNSLIKEQGGYVVS